MAMRQNQPAAPEQQQAAQAPAQEAAQYPPMELDVRVRPVNKGNLIAYASMNINGGFAVEGIKVMSGEKGLFVSMPSYQDKQGKYRDVCFPVTKEFRQQMNQAVLEQYQQTLSHMQSAAQESQQREAPEAAPVMGM